MLPLHLEQIHNVFYILLLQKAEIDPTWLLPQVPLEIKEDLTSEVRSIKILGQSEKGLRNKKNLYYKGVVEKLQNRWRNLERRIKNEEKISQIISGYRYGF
jgi:hypothetical protein